MTLYIAIGSFFAGVIAILTAGWLADRADKQKHQHVLGSIEQKLKRHGKLNRFNRKKRTGGMETKK